MASATLTEPRALGGISQPADLLRPLTLDGLVVLASSGPEDDSTAVRELCLAQGWPFVETGTTDAATWVTAARKTSLVVLTSTDIGFVIRTVAAVRRSTTTALVVVGTMSSFERKRALGAGADLVLPAELTGDELRLHLLALLRRVPGTWEPQVRYLTSGELTIDLWARECVLGDEPLHLSRTEYELLVFLMRHPRQAVPIEKIIQRVWRSRSYQGQMNAARIAVSRLRTKLRNDPAYGPFIRSVRGVGYEFVAPVLELGDSADDFAELDLGRLRLPAALLEIAEVLGRDDFATAAGFCIDTMVVTTGGGAGAIFHSDAGQITLLAQRGHPEEFLEFMRRGVSLRSRVEVHSTELRQPTQVDEIARLVKTSESVKIMSTHGFHSYLYIPLVVGGRVWGGMRLASRTKRPFDPVVTTFCSAVGAMLSLKLPRPTTG